MREWMWPPNVAIIPGLFQLSGRNYFKCLAPKHMQLVSPKRLLNTSSLKPEFSSKLLLGWYMGRESFQVSTSSTTTVIPQSR